MNLGERMRWLRPSHQHSALSATVLLMAAVMLSRLLGYLREAYIAWAFGAGLETDAYVAAFTLPDWLNYLVAGGTASITFISIFARYAGEQREEEGWKAFSIVITVMTAALAVGVAIAEIFAPAILGWFFPRFTPEQLALCVHLTRILLPAQIFFYAGGIVSAVLLSRRLFLLPALGGVFYNLGIILGGVVLGRQLGIASLAYGALAGAVAGPFLMNLVGAVRGGMHYRLSMDIRHPAFLEWVKLSVPLMLGVTLVAADEWILRFFAAGGTGDISRLNYAKRLFAVPIAVLGQAAGQASLPFYARLFGEKKMEEFASTVGRSVTRLVTVSFLVSAWMAACALPLVDLVYRRGRFGFSDSQQTAIFFFWFALSLALWSAQALWARAFYAAGDTLTPMIAGTLITLASLPVYSWMYAHYAATGLAVASDIGILAHTVALALLLERRKLVPLGSLDWLEVAKVLLVALLASAICYAVAPMVTLDGSRRADLLSAGLLTLTWAATAALGLWVMEAELLKELNRKNTPSSLA